MSEFDRYAQDPVAFTDDFMPVNELGRPFRLFEHQRELERAAYVFDADGRLPWDTFLDSRPKKESKSFDNGRRVVHWAYTQEAPNELYTLANDLEQSQSRVFAMTSRLIRNNPALAACVVTMDSRRIVLTNGTVICALASEYAGAAGSNHGLTSWDELWGYTSEASRRLWEEMTPVPTRRNSIRLITTYAGWEGESELLWDLYLRGVGPEEHPDGQGVRIHPTLPLYLNSAARQLTYWDHEGRMPWQTEAYRQTQRQTLREATVLRLVENRWTSSATRFISGELWDGNVDLDHHPLLPTPKVELVVGVDASTKHDTSAVVAVYREDDWLTLAWHRIWTPGGVGLDLEDTIELALRELCLRYRVAAIVCDPYQLHRSITTLAKDGLPIREFPQTVSNTVRMGQVLFELLKGMNLRLYRDEELRAQALNTTAVEGPRGFRIAKEKSAKKIDAIVALSMACVACLDEPVYTEARVW